MLHTSRLAVAAALVLALGVSPAVAIVPPDAPAGFTPAPSVPQAPLSADAAAALAASDPAFAAFAASTGATWVPRLDGLTGRPSLLRGSGAPWLPGRGNSLTWQVTERLPGRGNSLTWQVTGAGPAGPLDHAALFAFLEARARAVLAANPALFRVPASASLTADPASAIALDGGRLNVLHLRATKNGVPVQGASISFGVNSGNLVHVAMQGLGDGLDAAPTTPVVTAAAALAAAIVDVSALVRETLDVVDVVDEGSLVLLPVETLTPSGGRALGYRLAWRVAFRAADHLETFVSHRDALTGALITVFDDNRYACPVPPSPQGRVTGGVFLGPIEEVPESIVGMMFAEVDSGGTVVADYNGTFPFAVGQQASTSLSGRFFDMNCTTCTNPPQAFGVSDGPGNLALGVGGVDQVGNGISTRAERSCFYHLGVVRQLASKHLTDGDVAGFLTRRTPGVVNIASNCNAFWNGNGVNFFRSGGGCNNTGEIADVMQHEWGHGLDQFTGGGNDGARGEGLADVVAFLSTHDPNLGPYFQVGVRAGIRNADELVTPRGLLTVVNVGTSCPAGGGPLGREVHCEGEIFSQANWHLARNLRTKYGEVAGWYAAERLFFLHLPVFPDGTYLPGLASSAHDAMVFVDDDNGDLLDGTPNAAEINDAYGHHGIATTPNVPDSADCTPPAAPVPVMTEVRTNAATTLWQVRVSWPAVPGALQYGVYRNDAGGVGADVPVAVILPPVTEFLDDNVTDGVTYRYRVATFDAGGCVSTADNQVTAAVGALVSFALESTQIDDSSTNANGFADPGEALALVARVTNTSGAPATNVTATITSTHPGVTITRAAASFGNLAGGVTGPSSLPHLAFTLDPVLTSCGETIAFAMEIEATEGCSFASFLVRVGQFEGLLPLVSDDFETDTGWIVDPLGTDNATGGAFVRQDPNGTFNNRQPGDDHTPAPGTACLVTGNAVLDPRQQSSGGADDVDGGCTSVQSPVYDMGGVSGLEILYWRYFTIRTAIDDVFLAEVSNDGGSTWFDLERVAAEATPWRMALIPLDPILGAPADRVVVRFTICDTGMGSLLEALIDDFAIVDPQWLCEAPVAQPRLGLVSLEVRDTVAEGGSGNDDGFADPGEGVRLPISLLNAGNARAINVTGSLALVSGPAGTLVSDALAAWPDVLVSATQRSGADAPPHFEVTVPRGAACGARIELLATITYDGPSSSGHSIDVPLSVLVGAELDTVAFFDDMESGDNGWTHVQVTNQDDWQRGAPLGNSAFDPTAAWSGQAVWGNDLGGANADGNYRANTENYLQSAPIDCSALVGTRLSFRRWLSVEDGMYDQATILVNGTEIWANPTGGNVADTEWTYQEYDISAIADGQAVVTIRFTLQSDGGLQMGGWNLDDIRVFARQTVCASPCTGVPPATRPSGTVLFATGVKGEDGAEFEWPALTAAQDEYFRLRRGTTPLTLVDVVTPEGLTATSFDDRTAPDALYFYSLSVTTCLGDEGP